ncbi:hypothetical protein M8A51_08595 [Schlegelella sp. S2-27]|uniref:EAL domain-containing protein n=1 Tax=Caldimonas mangrovi TaxID=2944811 RepID=A0ABT0YMD5_9BURK|nr:hypothetical protein [Caldimonas mangrovi]MCM5679589.1 hypothetical protein [Caldimonas mangrovi]
MAAAGFAADAVCLSTAVAQLAHAGAQRRRRRCRTDARRDLLRGLQCDELQGFLFARPMSADAMSRWADGLGLPDRVRFSDSAFLPAAA